MQLTASPFSKMSRLLLALLIAPGLSFAQAVSGQYQVYLQSSDQTTSLNIATLHMQSAGSDVEYRLSMNDQLFGDYFLSMRPFKCISDKANMLCHLAYPYSLERRFSEQDFSALEHDFLFIRRKPTDYGIDPWNGLVYRIEKKGDEYIGQAHEVDLNVLAVPPDTPLPLNEAEIHQIDGAQLWLPRLLIKAE